MTPLNADEGIELGTESKPQGSLRVFARFTSIRELVRITDDLAATVAAERQALNVAATAIADLERRIRTLEGRVLALEGGR